MYLNFGHTIGHAVEQTAGYGKVMHGEAVAIGMVQISRVAEEKGLMPKGITRQIAEMCVKFGLPVDYEPWRVEELYTPSHMIKKLVAIALRQLSFQRLVRQLSIRFL